MKSKEITDIFAITLANDSLSYQQILNIGKTLGRMVANYMRDNSLSTPTLETIKQACLEQSGATLQTWLISQFERLYRRYYQRTSTRDLERYRLTPRHAQSVNWLVVAGSQLESIAYSIAEVLEVEGLYIDNDNVFDDFQELICWDGS